MNSWPATYFHGRLLILTDLEAIEVILTDAELFILTASYSFSGGRAIDSHDIKVILIYQPTRFIIPI